MRDLIDGSPWPVWKIAVDDGSTQTWERIGDYPEFAAIAAVDVLPLKRSLGHQRAIAIGLAYFEAYVACSHVLVMDCDGEDRPDDIPALIECGKANPQSLVFAVRAKRSVGPLCTNGLGAAAVFSDIVAVRLMGFSVILILLTLVEAASVLGYRTRKTFVPGEDHLDYIGDVRSLTPA